MKNKLIIFLTSLSCVFMLGCQESKNTQNNNQSTTLNDAGSNNISEDKNNTITPKEDNFKVCRMYYYDAQNEESYYTDVTLEIKDGAIVKSLIEQLKVIPENNLPSEVNEAIITIPSDINVKSAKLDKENNLLTVDFSKNFANSLGSAQEHAIITSITNTLGYNLNVDNVKITFNGQPYSSGHYEFTENDYFTTDFNESRILK